MKYQNITIQILSPIHKTCPNIFNFQAISCHLVLFFLTFPPSMMSGSSFLHFFLMITYLIFIPTSICLSMWGSSQWATLPSTHLCSTPLYLVPFSLLWNGVTSAPLLLLRSWVALSFKVCEQVRHPWLLSRSPLCSIYKGIHALYWPSIINC